MTIEEGRRRFRHTHGEFEDGELPSTRTGAQRGRLRRRAETGDLAAQAALAEYAAAKQSALKADLDARTAGVDDDG